MSTKSRTDWERINAMGDQDIDISDVPELDASMFAGTEMRLPKRKKSVSLHLDNDDLDWYIVVFEAGSGQYLGMLAYCEGNEAGICFQIDLARKFPEGEISAQKAYAEYNLRSKNLIFKAIRKDQLPSWPA